MAVEREEVLHPLAVGSCSVPRVYRGENGQWSVEFAIDFRIVVDDTRDVYVRKFINVTATEQRGRRRRARMGEGESR